MRLTAKSGLPELDLATLSAVEEQDVDVDAVNFGKLEVARREPPESTMTALQRLTRETTIVCALRLVLALSGGSESTSKSGAVH
jgi:hypothetical protein